MHSSEHINPKNNPIQEIQLMYILMGKETEAQKGSVTWTRSHSWVPGMEAR